MGFVPENVLVATIKNESVLCPDNLVGEASI